MNKRRTLALSLALLAALTLAVGVALAQSGVDWWVISGGGAPSSGGNVTLNDTLGQPIIGPSSGGNVWLGAGYWGAGETEEGPPPPPPIPVGGYIVPLSKLQLLLPWMGLVALVGLLLTGAVIVLRKRTRR